MASCTLTYSLSVTGDCLNRGSGAFSIDIIGNQPPYAYQFLSPVADPLPTYLAPGVTNITRTGLSSGTYSLQIFDSCGGTPTRVLVNAIISDGVCVGLSNHSNTFCGLNNGTISARTDNNLAFTNFYLYENTQGYISSGSSTLDDFVFVGLSAGTYYVTVNDGGGCTGRSESCIIKSSVDFDYGFYIVDDSRCETTATGKIFVTGLTGNPPYTYSWNNGGTSSSISGLTAGVYSVTVTDEDGCSLTKDALVSNVPPLGVAQVIPISPGCNQSDGQITIVVTGGTAPYSYVGSNGQTLITFSETFSLTGLASNSYTITITDAGLCTTSVTQPLTPPNGFTVVNVGIVNSTCNNSSGALSPITLLGGTPPFVYTLTYPSGNSIQQTVNGFSNQFQGLSAGTYTLSISNGPCLYTNTYTINNTEKYTLTTSVTGSTCNNSNGSVRAVISTGGTAPFTYQLTGQPTITNTSQTAVTFNNLFSGIYQLTVTDAQLCSQIQTVNVTSVDSIDFSLVGTDLTGTNNGTINLYITDGPAPYTINWSTNVNGQSGTTLSNLSAGTYSVTVIDGNGCQLTRQLTLNGYNNYGTYDVFTYCESVFENNGLTVLKKPQQMFLEGFYDLVSGETNCVLNEAVFNIQVDVGGSVTETPFFTSNSLSKYPTDNEWFDTIKETLLSYSVIGNVIIDPLQNKITIETNCTEQALSLNSAEVSVGLKINYDISCVCKIDPIPGPPINDCDMIYLDPIEQVVYYDYTASTSTVLSVDGYNFDSTGLAFTDTKMWMYVVGVGTTTIKEWNITTNPFTAVYNRDIIVNFEIGDAIGALSNTKLVTTNTSVTPNRFVEIDITSNTPIVTNKSLLNPNRALVGSINITSQLEQVFTLQLDLTNLPFVTYYLVVNDPTTYNQLFEIELTGVAGTPSGVFVNGNNLYIVDSSSAISELQTTSPYSFTPSSFVVGAGNIHSFYQRFRCITETIELPSITCGQSAAVLISTGEQDGYYETYVNVGGGTGVVEVLFNTAQDDVPMRYQLIWNNIIVADTQFLGQNIISDNILISDVTGTTTLNKYVYYPGNGNATTVQFTTDWYTNGILSNLSFEYPQNFASTLPRGNGGDYNQIGIVPNYPTPGSPAWTPDVKLQFTKTSITPSQFKIVAYGLTGSVFQYQVTSCPAQP